MLLKALCRQIAENQSLDDLQGATEQGMKIAPSTYCAARPRPPSTQAVFDEQLLVVIQQIWEDNFLCYGVVKMWLALHRASHQVGRDRVARLMRVAGISRAVRGRRWTVTTRPGSPAIDDAHFPGHGGKSPGEYHPVPRSDR